LRGNFVVAASKGPHSSVFARLVPPWRESFYETIILQTFCEIILFGSPPISLVVQTRFLVARARKQAPKTKRAGRNLPGSPLFVSAKKRGSKGIPRLKRRKPAPGKEGSMPFLARRLLFCPGMGSFGHREFSFFTEPAGNTSCSESSPIFGTHFFLQD